MFYFYVVSDIYCCGTGVGQKPGLIFFCLMGNMKRQCRFKLYLTELEPPASPSCWNKKKQTNQKKPIIDRFLWRTVTQRARNVQRTEEEDAQHQSFKGCQGNAQGHLWCCARKERPERSGWLLKSCSCSEAPSHVKGSTWLNSSAYRRMDQARKGKQICACDNL